ncbi:MAG TPA: hypothetical protein VJM08_08900, partial [Anaerolineales bacterium]|nr:hypothetical protein [Anaerolineales bacterium]
MPFNNRKSLISKRILSGILVAVYLCTVVLPQAVFAMPEQNSQQQFPAAKHEPKRGRNPETGKVSFIGGGDPIFVPGVSDVEGLSPEERARGMANAYGEEFGLKNPSKELKVLKSKKDGNGKDVVHFQQVYEGVPIFAGELIVNMNVEGELLSISGEVASDLTLDTKPAIKAQEARKTALTEIATLHNIDESELTATDPELWIFDESILTTSTRPVELVWRLEITAKDAIQPIREMVLVNAQTEELSFHINQVDTHERTRSEMTQPISNSEQAASLMVSSPIQYVDLIADEVRGKLYAADKTGNKIDVIDMNDLSITSSYVLTAGALPTGIDLRPDGNELAVAQSGLDRVKFINLTDGTMSEMSSPLSGLNTKAFDVLYGRPGILYALSTNGIHTINTSTHAEDTSQFVSGVSDEKFGAITSDKNTLFYVTGTCCSGYNHLHKFNVSAGLAQPLELGYTYLHNSGYKRNIRLSLADDNTLITSFGTIYNVSDLTPKAKNGQVMSPAISLPRRDFYATVYDNTSGIDSLYFFDKESSYKVSTLNTVSGAPGAMATTSNGNVLFVSSTGGMAKYDIGLTPPGTPVSLPQSLTQYRDFAFDMPRGVIYGTDASGRIDVIDQNAGYVLDSYLLPNGANPIGIDLSPDGAELAIALNGLEKILFINPETGARVAESTPQLSKDIYYTNLPYDVIYGREGRLYSNGNPGSGGIDYIHVFHTGTHNWLAKSTYSVRTGAKLAITADKRYLYANETFSPNNIHVFDIRTDSITKLYQGPHGPVYANRFTITPDGNKVFTSYGQVWSGNMQERLGSLEVGALETGSSIEYIPGQDAVVLVAYEGNGSMLSFVNSVNYRLLTTYRPNYDGSILEMEISPDGSKLIVNFSIGAILVLDISAILPVPPTPPPTPALSTIQYADLVVDEARGKLYGADKAGSKIDVINLSDMFVTGSYLLPYGASPTSIDLSPDGNELAVAQSVLSRVVFINLNDGTISETPAPLSGSTTVNPVNPYDVVYGRPGILYALSNTGIHTINTSSTPHAEDTTQYVPSSS